MKINKEGVELIKRFEGCRLKAYKCAAGVWTIGYGHTKGVKANDTITQEEAEKLLLDDITKYENHVSTFKNYKFNNNEFSALVSFAFNVGSINQLTNNGKRTKYQIAQHIKKYVYAAGKKLDGLVKRRKAEYDLFNKPDGLTVRKGKVLVSNLQIRKGPDVKSQASGKLKKGSIIEILDIVKEGNNIWYKHAKGFSAAVYNDKEYIKEV